MTALDRKTREFNVQVLMFGQAVAGRLGINPTDLQCLNVLSLTGPITAGRLAEITVGAITGVLDRLGAAGYARRERDEDDRRRVVVHLGPENDELELAPLFDHVRQASAELYSVYTDEELSLILDFFTKAVPMLRQQTTRLRAQPTDR